MLPQKYTKRKRFFKQKLAQKELRYYVTEKEWQKHGARKSQVTNNKKWLTLHRYNVRTENCKDNNPHYFFKANNHILINALHVLSSLILISCRIHIKWEMEETSPCSACWSKLPSLPHGTHNKLNNKSHSVPSVLRRLETFNFPINVLLEQKCTENI